MPAVYHFVTLVDGVPQCGCGEPVPPGDCCMYPWPDPSGAPLYPDTDLPISVVVSYDSGPTETLSLTSGLYEYISASYILDAYGPSSWQLYYLNELVASFLCLIGHISFTQFTVTDEFLDNYSVEFKDAFEVLQTISVTRDVDNICFWFGSDASYSITLGAPSSGSALEFGLSIYNVTTEETTNTTKIAPQSSPVGSYVDGGGYTEISVS